MRTCFGLTVISMLLSCGSDPTPAPPAAPPDQCRIAVVNSNYGSTSNSLLRSDGTLCVDNIVNSGSVAPKLVNALSGDVVLPTSNHPDGWITPIDRQLSVLTFIDPTDYHVIRQMTVADDKWVNPHDIAFVSRTKAYVSRAEVNDLLVIDPSTGARGETIDLQHLAQPGLQARPSKMALAADRLYACLIHIDAPDFTTGGVGRVATVATADGQVTGQVDFPTFQNCANPALTPDQQGLWVTFTGVFEDENQLDRSGVAYVSTDSSNDIVWSATAGSLTGRPIGRNTAVIDECRLVYVALGSLTPTEVSDRLFVVNRCDGTNTDLGPVGGPYNLSAVIFEAAENRLLVANADPKEPRIQRFELSIALHELPASEPNPSVGLEPREMEWFR